MFLTISIRADLGIVVLKALYDEGKEELVQLKHLFYGKQTVLNVIKQHHRADGVDVLLLEVVPVSRLKYKSMQRSSEIEVDLDAAGPAELKLVKFEFNSAQPAYQVIQIIE